MSDLPTDAPREPDACSAPFRVRFDECGPDHELGHQDLVNIESESDGRKRKDEPMGEGQPLPGNFGHGGLHVQ